MEGDLGGEAVGAAGRGRRGRERVVEEAQEGIEEALEHRLVELPLAVEVVVDALGADADAVGDLAEGRGLVAALGEELLGGGENALRGLQRGLLLTLRSTPCTLAQVDG